MALYTAEEYAAKKPVSKQGKTIKAKRVRAKKPAPSGVWLFFHCENAPGDNREYTQLLELGGKRHFVEWINGKMETSQKEVAEFLTQKGHYLLNYMEV